MGKATAVLRCVFAVVLSHKITLFSKKEQFYRLYRCCISRWENAQICYKESHGKLRQNEKWISRYKLYKPCHYWQNNSSDVLTNQSESSLAQNSEGYILWLQKHQLDWISSLLDSSIITRPKVGEGIFPLSKWEEVKVLQDYLQNAWEMWNGSQLHQ